jgi:transcriptional regulator with XRE-family HTH domain
MRISESRLKCNVQPFWFNDLLGWLLAKPVTLKMIAERLGVSVQTVSNVLQSTGRVAAATAERVQKVASEMGYVPNAGAQALRGKSTKTLSFILSDPVLTTTPSAYLGFLIPVVASAIREAGFTPSIQFADDTDIDAALLPARQGLVDGVLLLANRSMPDRSKPFLGCPSPLRCSNAKPLWARSPMSRPTPPKVSLRLSGIFMRKAHAVSPIWTVGPTGP